MTDEIRTDNNEYRWLTLAEACQVLGVSDRTIRRRIDGAQLTSRLEKGRRLIRISATDTRQTVDSHEADRLVGRLEADNEYLRGQLADRDRHFEKLNDELSQVRKRSDMLMMQLTQQLDRAHLQLEDLREKHPWWKWWSRKSLSGIS
jgi:excisionase family DNA binding protein